MKSLTKNNIENLRNHGYLYLLGQTQSLTYNPDSTLLTRIVLKPTKADMNTEIMPAAYDCYFNLNNDEAMDLVYGADGVEFLIEQES